MNNWLINYYYQPYHFIYITANYINKYPIRLVVIILTLINSYPIATYCYYDNQLTQLSLKQKDLTQEETQYQKNYYQLEQAQKEKLKEFKITQTNQQIQESIRSEQGYIEHIQWNLEGENKSLNLSVRQTPEKIRKIIKKISTITTLSFQEINLTRLDDKHKFIQLDCIINLTSYAKE